MNRWAQEFVQGLTRQHARSTISRISFPGSPRRATRSRDRGGRRSQAVVVDDKLYTLNQKSPKRRCRRWSSCSGVTRFRPELDVYILIAQEPRTRSSCPLRGGGPTATSTARNDYRACTDSSRADPGAIAHAVLRPASRTTSGWRRLLAHSGTSSASRCAQPLGSRFLRFHGRTCLRRRPLGVVEDARSLMEPPAWIAEAQTIAARLRGAPHLLRNQRHSTSNKGHFPDAARAGRKAAARPQLPQVGAPRVCSRAAIRSISIPRSTPSTACTVRWPKKTILRRSAGTRTPRRASSPPAPYDGLRYDLGPHRRGGARKGIKVIVDEACTVARFHPAFRPRRSKRGRITHASTHKGPRPSPKLDDPRDDPGSTAPVPGRTSTCTRPPARSTA